MRRLLTVFALVIFYVTLLTGCTTELSEAFDSVVETSPSACKEYCTEKTDCQFDEDDFEADAGDLERIEDKEYEDCVLSCARPMAPGTFLYSINSKFNLEVDRMVSGDEYQKMFECMINLDVDTCKDDVYILDFWEDESDCTDMAICFDIIVDFDHKCEWDEASQECYCRFENVLADGMDIINSGKED